MNNRTRTYQKGLWAESLAGLFLRLKGYKILEQRYKTRSGEIDIIAKNKNMIVFIEVKNRQTQNQALHSLTPKMKQRIGNAARYFIAQNPSYIDHDMRFDLITITPPFFIHHLDNAWMLTA